MTEWTPGRLKAFITSVLRGGFRRFPNKYVVLKNAFVGSQINVKSGRIAKHYKCNICKGSFPAKEVQVDHIKPIVPASGFTTWDDFIAGLYCEVENLQVACLTCHALKTLQEKQERKKH